MSLDGFASMLESSTDTVVGCIQAITVLLFLDIDGVLRRKQSPLYRLDPDCLQAFEEAIRPLAGVQIVITSTWREAFTLDEMRGLFSRDIALRVIGATPIAPNRDGHYRHREVLAYLKLKGREGEPWLALDDDPLHYPPLDNVLLIDAERGFDSDAMQRLIAAVQNAH